MIIETKFDKGDMVYFIHDNSIKRMIINSVQYEDGNIMYSFLLYKGLNVGSSTFIVKEESNCFKSTTELAEYYQKKLEPQPLKELS